MTGMRFKFGIALVALVTPVLAVAADFTPISEADLRQHIAALASDDYEGRAPGTAGESKTVTYIANQWSAAGLKGGMPDGGWYQPVDLLTLTPGKSQLSVRGSGKRLSFSNDAVMLRSREAAVKLDKLPMLFAGYGVDADGKVEGDVAGKLVLLLMAEPDYGTMRSYSARRDAVAAAGAAVVIGILPEKANWNAYKRNFTDGTTIDSRLSSAKVEGMMRMPTAKALLDANRLRIDDLTVQAAVPGFEPVALKDEARLAVATTTQRTRSHNIVAKISGKLGSDKGAILFLGHWDHLGLCRPEGEADRICNGAVDNASGIAVLIEAAKRLAKAPQMDRDIYFLATTAEEKGLLGAYAFAAHPAIPLDKIALAINLDTVAVVPKGEKVAILGRGSTALDADIDKVIRAMGRVPETGTESNVMLQRQDGWALKANGVPTVMVGGSFADMKKLEAYLGGDYHGPKDELNDSVILSGAAEDADLHVALGRYFGNVATWAGPGATPPAPAAKSAKR
ncbi:peptidase M28 [Pseudonocardia sp. TMWB2A]